VVPSRVFAQPTNVADGCQRRKCQLRQAGQLKLNKQTSRSGRATSARCQTAICGQGRGRQLRRPSVPAAKLTGVAIQEAQSLLVELGRALVNGSMCAGLEHEKLAAIDTVGQRVSEA
jgi:hypothetical protein